LTRKTPADNINFSSPRSSVEGGDIIPDWELWQDAVPLPLQQDFPAIRFNLDSTDWGMSEKDAAEDSSPCSSK
jgi:hypothetical protein